MRFPMSCALLMALMACDGSPFASANPTLEDLQSLILQTDRASYTAKFLGGEGAYRTYGATVVVQFTNSLPYPVYLLRCYPDTPYPVFSIPATEGGLESGYDPTWACVGHSHHIVVKAGKTRTDSLRIAGPNAWDGLTKAPLGTLTGRFRLWYGVGTCPDLDCDWGQQSIQSNEFEIRREAS